MIKTIIVDDEPMARKNLGTILSSYCKTDIEIVAEAGTVPEAYDAIRKHEPDLVFLDIEIGAETGFDLIARFESPGFNVIFVTAFDEYAIQAIKFSALDYILKPLNIKEIQMAVSKVNKFAGEEKKGRYHNLKKILSAPGHTQNRMAIPTLTGYQMVAVSSITHLSAEKDYTYIHCTDQPTICSSSNIGHYEEMLLPYGFFRIHHSYIINRQHLQQYNKGEGGEVITLQGISLPVSRRKKQEFIDWLNEI